MEPYSVSVKMLASGSSGNALLVQAGGTSILVDCGITLKAVVAGLDHRQVDPASIDAILLTHEHVDHASGAGAFSRRYGTPVVADSRTLDAVAPLVGSFNRRSLPVGSVTSIGHCEVASFPVAHDAAAPAGYLVSHGDRSVAVCVDLGTADESLHEPLSQADLLVIEANHDFDRLTSGPYPATLKSRILSEKGHLSNLEAARLIAGSDRGRWRTVWLAHLSAVNNSPKLAARIVGGFLRCEGVRQVRLQVALRDKPSLTWSTETVGWQLALPV